MHQPQQRVCACTCSPGHLRHPANTAGGARAKRFLEETRPPHRGGAARLRSWLPGAGVGYRTIGSGFHDWFFDLAGTVDSGAGAQVPDRIV